MDFDKFSFVSPDIPEYKIVRGFKVLGRFSAFSARWSLERVITFGFL